MPAEEQRWLLDLLCFRKNRERSESSDEPRRYGVVPSTLVAAIGRFTE